MKLDKSDRICAFCEKACKLYDEDTMLCQKKGVVCKSFSCSKFSYDPLKRVPPKTQSAPKLEFVDINN